MTPPAAGSGFSRTVLIWLERSLIAIGCVLLLWCAIAIARMWYYKSMPIPPPTATHGPSLPGETPTGTTGTMAPHKAKTGTWVARLEAPSVQMSATVLEGTDDGTLARGAGHIEETPFPGEPGNIGIAGHRDTIFRSVRHLHAGDPLVLTTRDHVYRYRITKTSIVDPEDVYVLDPADHPTLTLVTCYPFEFIGHAPRRFIVHADLAAAETRSAAPGEAGKPGGVGK
jgi:sortase A